MNLKEIQKRCLFYRRLNMLSKEKKLLENTLSNPNFSDWYWGIERLKELHSQFTLSSNNIYFSNRGGIMSKFSSIDHQPINRQQFFEWVDTNKTILEMGPYCAPLFKGENVSYFDVLTQPEMKEKAKTNDHGMQAGNCPEITYVSPIGDLSIVDKTFDYLISSHNLEHLTDLVAHFKVAANLLNKTGYYFLALPDHRYCFDHFMTPSSIFDVMLASHNKDKIHTLKTNLERSFKAHNDPARHWRGDHGDLEVNASFKEKYSHILNNFDSDNEQYIDHHKWYFTPQSFREIIDRLTLLSEIPFKIEAITETTRNSVEFYVVLSLN